MVEGSAFAKMAWRMIRDELKPGVQEVLEREGVLSLIDFACELSSVSELVEFLRNENVVDSPVVRPWWLYARLPVRKELQVRRQVQHVAGPGVPDPPRPELVLPKQVEDEIMRVYLDMADKLKWHPACSVDEELSRRELVLTLVVKKIDSVKSRLSVWKRWVRWHESQESNDSVYGRLSATGCLGVTDRVSVCVLGITLVAGYSGCCAPSASLMCHTHRGRRLCSWRCNPLFAWQLAISALGICNRWKHAQRSVLEGVSGTLIVGECSRGSVGCKDPGQRSDGQHLGCGEKWMSRQHVLTSVSVCQVHRR